MSHSLKSAHELHLEKNFIEILSERENQWTYHTDIKSVKALWEKLRNHINRINIAKPDGEQLPDSEFSRLIVR